MSEIKAKKNGKIALNPPHMPLVYIKKGDDLSKYSDKQLNLLAKFGFIDGYKSNKSTEKLVESPENKMVDEAEDAKTKTKSKK